MTGAMAFATIVGLLSDFRSERSSGNLEEFIHWLRGKQHDDVAVAIARNQALLHQLTDLLSTNHEELIDRFSTLDQILSSVAGHIEGFSGLALAIHPQNSISDQAVSVLTQLIDSGAKLFMEHKITSGKPDEYVLMEGGSGRIQYDDPRFMEDDLNALIKLGLLRLEFTRERKTRRFFVTREAVRFVNAIRR